MAVPRRAATGRGAFPVKSMRYRGVPARSKIDPPPPIAVPATRTRPPLHRTKDRDMPTSVNRTALLLGRAAGTVNVAVPVVGGELVAVAGVQPRLRQSPTR